MAPEITPASLMVLGEKRRGRPPRSGVRATNRIEIVVTPSEREQLQRVADESGQKVATVIREAVNEFVADYGERRVFRSGPFE